MSQTPATSTPASLESRRWTIFAVAYLLMLLFALPLQELPPLFYLLRREVPISHSGEGFLMGSYGIPGLFMPIAAAILAAKFNTRRMLVAGCLILGIGLLIFSLVSSYPLLAAGRITAGIGGKIILSLAPLLVIAAFRNNSLGVVIGIFNSAVPLGSILSLNLFGFVGPLLGWRGATLALAVGATIMAVVSAVVLKDVRADQENEALTGKNRRIDRIIWLLASINFIINLVTLAYITFATQFYQASGVSVAESNLLSSFILIATVIFGPITGLLIDRFGRKSVFLAVSALLMTLSLSMMGIPNANFHIWTALLGIAAAVVPVVVFPLLNESVEPHQVSLGIAILIIASNLGGTIGPFVFGWVLDVTDSFRVAFTCFAIIALLMLPVVVRLKMHMGEEVPNREPRRVVR